jgi:DNA-binding transcriptional LysR family regulator
VSGEGFAFGWDHIVRNLLERGLLLARKDWAWNTGRGVYLVWTRDKPLSAQAVDVRDWIIGVSDFPND